MTMTYDGTNGITFPDSSLQKTAAKTGMVNRIINGAMMIDQRNAGASVTPTNGQFSVDRWKCALSQASKYSIQQNAGSVTPPVGFTKYLGVTSLSSYAVGASETFDIRHQIEGFNVADLAWGTANAQTVTISFWVRSSLTGTFGGSLSNNVSNRSYPFSYSIAAANTWTPISIIIAGDTTGSWTTDNSTGIQLAFSLGAGASYLGTSGSWASSYYLGATGQVNVVGTNGATFYITGVQLEKGSVATSFEYRPYGTELALCQRYYAKMVADSAYTSFGVGQAASTAVANVYIKYPVSMRASPTINAANCALSDGQASSALTISTSNAGRDSALQAVTATGLTQYRAYVLISNNNTAGFIDFSAEL